ncbi:MAG: hypothetical protein WEF50_15680 [Myxococcota bacterium]
MGRAPVLLVARLLPHAAFLALWVVWLSGTEKPSKPFAVLLALAAVVLLGPLLVPGARERWLSWLRRATRPLDVLSVNLALLLVLTEAGARVVQALAPSPLLVPPNAKAENAMGAQLLPPGSVYRGFPVNSLGFVDEEFRRARAPGVGRIAALGDSFAVAAVPYRENFLTLLDDLLDRDGRWEVMNFGVSGVSPREYLHVYRTQARFFDPDLVLLCFFIGNDFRELRPSSLLHGGSLYFFALVRRLWAMSAEPKFTRDRTDSLGEDTFRKVELQRVRLAARDLDRDTERRYPATFRQLREIAMELGPRLRLVIIPDEYQVNPELLPELLGSAEAAAAYDVEQPSRRLREFLDGDRIPYLDLLEPLRAAEADGRTYIPNNTHWNARGNRVAAEAISRWLGEERGR